MQTSWIRSAVAAPLIGVAAEAAAALEQPVREATVNMPLSAFVQRIEDERKSNADRLAVWRSGEAMLLTSMGQLGEAVGNARSLGEALKTFARGFPLLQSNTSVTFEVVGEEAQVSYRILDPQIWPRRADAELSLGLIRGICARFGIASEAILGVTFEHPADGDLRDLAQHLGCTPRFGQDENRLRLAASVLSNRPRASDQGEESYAESWRRLDEALRSQRAGTPMTARVYEKVLQRIGHGPASQVQIATELGLSERSLRRVLAAEGTAFSEILETCRRMQGYALLTRSDRPLSEVALLLGYSDQTAFSRAFARWYGVSPRELRREGAIEDKVIR